MVSLDLVVSGCFLAMVAQAVGEGVVTSWLLKHSVVDHLVSIYTEAV